MRSSFFVTASCKAYVLLLTLAMLTACGGGGTQVSLDSDTGDKQVSLTVSGKARLEGMEAERFASEEARRDCRSYRSPHAAEVETLALRMNDALMQADYGDTFPVRAVLLNEPPREDGTVGIYLCDGMEEKAYTLFRSVFISNGFMDDLKATSLAWGREELYEPALGFVLFHETGHAMLNHSAVKLPDEPFGGVSGYDLPLELSADRFAYDLMTKTGLPPEGALMAKSVSGTDRYIR